MTEPTLYARLVDAIAEDGMKPHEERRGLAHAMLDTVQPELDRLTAERDGAYAERAQLLAWLAATNPAVTTPATDIAEPGWQILYLTTPAGQLSWHIHPRDTHLFWHVEHLTAGGQRTQWDGHTTEEKYQRIRQLIETVRILSCEDVIDGLEQVRGGKTRPAQTLEEEQCAPGCAGGVATGGVPES